MMNDYFTGLCIYSTIFIITVLKCTLCTYKTYTKKEQLVYNAGKSLIYLVFMASIDCIKSPC